jgi:hypothetical protein
MPPSKLFLQKLIVHKVLIVAGLLLYAIVYKIISKVLVIRLNKLLYGFISPEQFGLLEAPNPLGYRYSPKRSSYYQNLTCIYLGG